LPYSGSLQIQTQKTESKIYTALAQNWLEGYILIPKICLFGNRNDLVSFPDLTRLIA